MRSGLTPTRVAARPRPVRSRSDSASSRCSVETYWSESLPASVSAARRMASSSAPGCATASAGEAGPATGSSPERPLHARAQPIDLDAELGEHSQHDAAGRLRARSGAAAPGAGASNAESRCSGVTCGLRASWARRPAVATASWDLMVKRSACMAMTSWGCCETGIWRRRRARARGRVGGSWETARARRGRNGGPPRAPEPA